MQDRPTARELLATLNEFFEEELLPSISGPLQYRVRVAANLVRIIERELALGQLHDENEHASLRSLVDGDEHDDLSSINAQVSSAIAAGAFDGNPEALWSALMDVARAKLAVVKPGYDAYDGSIEQP